MAGVFGRRGRTLAPGPGAAPQSSTAAPREATVEVERATAEVIALRATVDDDRCAEQAIATLPLVRVDLDVAIKGQRIEGPAMTTSPVRVAPEVRGVNPYVMGLAPRDAVTVMRTAGYSRVRNPECKGAVVAQYPVAGAPVPEQASKGMARLDCS